MGLSNIQTIRKHIPKEWEGSYFEIPFSVPEQTERIDVEYSYTRKRDTEDGGWTRSREINVIDLAVSAPQGEYIGSSGSDRTRKCGRICGRANGLRDVEHYRRSLQDLGWWGRCHLYRHMQAKNPPSVPGGYSYTHDGIRRSVLRG